MSHNRRAWLFKWFSLLAALTAAGMLYSRALTNPYISDDKLIVAGNPMITQPEWGGLAALWRLDYWTAYHPRGMLVELSTDHNLYRPITIFTYWLNAQFDEILRPVGLGQASADQRRRVVFRIFNVGLHGWAAWMVALWCARLMGIQGSTAYDRSPEAGTGQKGKGRSPSRSARRRRAKARVVSIPKLELAAGWGALTAGLVVLFHPIASDVINRIVGRADLLVLLAVSGFLAVQAKAQVRGWTVSRTASAIGWALVAFGSKESGLILLPLSLFQAWIIHRASVLGAAGISGEPMRRFFPGRIGFIFALLILPLMLYLLGRIQLAGVLKPNYPNNPLWDILQNPLIGKSLSERLPAAATICLGHLRLLVWPHPLIAYDQPERLPQWSDSTATLGLILGLMLFFLLVSLTVKRHVLALAIAWIFTSFFIISQIIAPIGIYTEVRLAYPMLGGLGLAVGWLIYTIIQRRGHAGYAVPSVLLILCAAGTILGRERTSDYRTEIELIQADARHRPDNPATLLRLAEISREAGKLAEARAALRRASNLVPDSPQVWYEFATFELDLGDMGEAIRLYQRALELEPHHSLALLNLGLIYWKQGDLEMARTFLYRAEKEAPQTFLIVYNLALYEASTGQKDLAIDRLERLVGQRMNDRIYTMIAQALDNMRRK